MDLANILIQERKKLEKTQQQVADDLYVSRQTLSNWENGKNFPDVPTLIKLSNYYDFSLDIMKGDQNLMKKVEADYRLINVKRANKKYAWMFSILTVLLIVAASATRFIRHDPTMIKTLTLLICLLTFALLASTENFLKLIYREYRDYPNKADIPLFVPKGFGYGVTINPYHLVGKLIFVFLLLATVVTFLTTAISFFI